MKAPRFLWRWLKVGPRLAYAAGLAPLVGRFVLLLTTTGRRSGRAKVTPLTYDELEGTYFVASAHGRASDWLRNILHDPAVVVQVGKRRFQGRAEVFTDQVRMADCLQRQMEHNPRMFGFLLPSEGLSGGATRRQIEELAAKRTLAAIHPDR